MMMSTFADPTGGSDWGGVWSFSHDDEAVLVIISTFPGTVGPACHAKCGGRMTA